MQYINFLTLTILYRIPNNFGINVFASLHFRMTTKMAWGIGIFYFLHSFLFSSIFYSFKYLNERNVKRSLCFSLLQGPEVTS